MTLGRDAMKKIGHNYITLRKIMIILGIVLVIELIIFALYKLFYKDNNCYDIYDKQYNDLLVIDDGYISIGYNNYKGTEDAKYYKDELIYQGEIEKLDKDLNTVWTTSYYLDGNVTLTDIVKIKDGYIIVGTQTVELTHDNDNTGIIIKVDKDGKIVKSLNYDLLDSTALYQIERDGNTNVIIGYSHYLPDIIGNHLGGGIILKVDDDLNIVEQNNYGGNKSGVFDKLFILDDSYLVYGMDAGYPIIVKFDKNFNREADDTDLISKKVIYNKTLSKDLEFYPFYYNDNKLYDRMNYLDIETGNIGVYDKDNVLNEKILVLITDDKYYATNTGKNFGTIIYQYDKNLKLIREDKNEVEVIKEIIPIKDNVIVIGNFCNGCNCTPKIKMLIRQ